LEALADRRLLCLRTRISNFVSERFAFFSDRLDCLSFFFLFFCAFFLPFLSFLAAFFAAFFRAFSAFLICLSESPVFFCGFATGAASLTGAQVSRPVEAAAKTIFIGGRKKCYLRAGGASKRAMISSDLTQ
jgi:hypothetical protein